MTKDSYIVEHETVRAAQAGDAAASRLIIEQLHQPLLGFVYRLLGPSWRPQLEDIAQDVFLKVFRALDRFDHERGVRFSTWVFTMARNHCFDLLKKRRVPTVSLSAGDPERSPWDPEDAHALRPERAALSREIGARLDQALREINPEQAEVYDLRERQGWEFKDIARRMGVAEGTIKSRLHRARAALRQLLADLQPQPTPHPA